MAYVNTKAMLCAANESNTAVGAFNFSNMETLQAIVSASERANRPVIVQASESAVKYAGADMLVSMVKAIAKKSKIDVALHLDHGATFEICKAAIDAGFSSVMIDGSHLPFDENVAVTRKVVTYAHKKNVSVEGELGKIKGVEDAVKQDNDCLTDPLQAVEFVRLTGVDSLAISIGTAHGVNKGTDGTQVRVDVLRKIDKALEEKVPLVLHGASTVNAGFVAKIKKFDGILEKAQGISEKVLKKLVKTAITKINMDTDIRLCFTASVREFLHENPGVFDPRKILGETRKQTEEYIYYVTKNILN